MLLTAWLSRFTKNSRFTRRPARRRMARASGCTETLERRAMLAATILTPVDGTVFNSLTGQAVAISGTATAAGPTARITISDTSGATADIVIDATVTGGTFATVANITSQADGTITITVDENEDTVAEDTATVTLDKALPATPTVDIEGGAVTVTAAQLTAGGDLDVTGTADPNTTVNLTLIGEDLTGAPRTLTKAVITTAAGTFATTFDLDVGDNGVDFADGPLAVVAQAVDPAGNFSGAATDAVILDVAAAPTTPTVDIESGAVTITPANLTAGGDLDVTITAGANTTVNLTLTGVGAGPLTQSVVTNGAGVATTTFDLDVGNNGLDFSAGPITVSAVAVDAAGNPSGVGADSVVLVTDVASPLTPTVIVGGAVAGADNVITAAELGAGGLLTVSGTAEAGSTVRVLLTASDGSVLPPATAVADGAGNYSVTFDLDVGNNGVDVPDGTLTAIATAADAAGNLSLPASDTAELRTDATIATPTVVIEAGDNDIRAADLTGGDLLDVSGTAEAGSSVQLTLIGPGGFVLTKTVTATAAGTYSTTFDLDADNNGTLDVGRGTVTVVAQATDVSGNISTAVTDTAELNVGVGGGSSGGGGTVRVRVKRNGEVVIRPGRGQPASSLEVAQTATGLVLRGLNGTTIQTSRHSAAASTFSLSSNAVTLRGRFGRSNDDVLFDNEGGTGNTNIIFNGRGGTNRYAPTDFLFGTRSFTNFSEVTALT